MLVNSTFNNIADIKQVLIWAASFLIFMLGFKFLKEVFVWVLDELYKMLIQHQG